MLVGVVRRAGSPTSPRTHLELNCRSAWLSEGHREDSSWPLSSGRLSLCSGVPVGAGPGFSYLGPEMPHVFIDLGKVKSRLWRYL